MSATVLILITMGAGLCIGQLSGERSDILLAFSGTLGMSHLAASMLHPHRQLSSRINSVQSGRGTVCERLAYIQDLWAKLQHDRDPKQREQLAKRLRQEADAYKKETGIVSTTRVDPSVVCVTAQGECWPVSSIAAWL